jgi:hypothetical protein
MQQQREHFYVVSKDGAWNVKHGAQYLGPYVNQKVAIADAITKAKALNEAGHKSQVLVQGEGGSFRTEWTYGADPERRAG